MTKVSHINSKGMRMSELATPAQVAEFLHTTVASLSQDRYKRVGVPYIKHGSRILYRWSDVHAYLAANTVNPGAA